MVVAMVQVLPCARLARPRVGRMLACAATALAMLLVGGTGTAQAAMSIDSGPAVRVNPAQVTIWWHSSSTASSELRWDTTQHANFDDYPNDASNTATTLGTVHSRTLGNLPAGTYYYQVRSTGAAGVATSATRRFVVEPSRGATPLGSTVVSGSAGSVESTLISGGRTYIGGSFEQVGQRLGAAITVDPITGAVAPGTPQVQGFVLRSIPDGAGGYYVAGVLDRVGGLRREGIAHLLPDGGVDPHFDPGAGPDIPGANFSLVYALAKSGNRIYAGGAFTEFDGLPRSGLVALDATTGEVEDNFDPGTGFASTGWPASIVTSGTGTIVVGGEFTEYDGVPVGSIVAVDSASGAIDPTFDRTGIGSGNVMSLVRRGTTIYAGGGFSTFAGAAHNDLVAIDASTGQPIPGFSAGAGAGGADGVSVLELNGGGTRLFVGGTFTNFGGSPRNNLTAVSPTTGAVEGGFNVGSGTDGGVGALSFNANRLHVGGNFTNYNGAPRTNAVVVNAGSGVVDPTFNTGTGPNNTVFSISTGGTHTLLGGAFTSHNGTLRNNIAALTTATGALDTGFNPGTGTDNPVYSMTISGTRLYLGGSFTTYDGAPRGRVAAVDSATGAVDPAFLPGAGAVGEVHALAVSGTRLYLGGNFGIYAGATRNNVAAVSATTAAVDNGWDPPGGANGAVQALAVNGARLYVGGEFTSFGGVARPYIASVTTAAGAVDATFDPGTGPNGSVYALAVGARLYIGGTFTSYNGTARSNVAAVGLSTASLYAPFAPVGSFDDTVSALATTGTTLYVGGVFTELGTVERGGLIGLDTATGAVLDTFQSGPESVDPPHVRGLSTDGSHLAVGGFFRFWGSPSMIQDNMAVLPLAADDPTSDTGPLTVSVPQHDVTPAQTTITWTSSATGSSDLFWDTQSRTRLSDYASVASNTATSLGTSHSRTISNLPAGTYYYRVRTRNAAGDRASSAERSFVVTPPSATSPLGAHVTDGAVHASGINATGTTLYVGGTFERVAVRGGSNIGVNTTTGAALPGMPQVNGLVWDMVSDGAGGWFIGGSFQKVGGHTTVGLAHLLPDGGVDRSWSMSGVTGVRSLVVSGGSLYVGGIFASAGGQPRNGLAAFNATTGALLPWNPNAGANASVLDMVLSGTTLYVGGNFTTIDGQPRANVAAITLATGLPTAWNPGASNAVNDLEANATTLFVGGRFSTFGGQPRAHLASVTIATGAVTAWAPSVGVTPDSMVNAMALSGTTLYVGGTFTTVGMAARVRLAAIDTGTGNATGWNPGANSSVNNLLVTPTSVYAAGSFTTAGGSARPHLVEISRATGLATSFDPRPTGAVNSLELTGSTLYLGGYLTGVGGVDRNHAAAFDARTGELLEWNPNTDQGVTDVEVSATAVYLGGAFTTVGGSPRASLARVDLVTGALNAWNPGTNGQVHALALNGAILYVGGGFTTLGGVARSNFGAVHTGTGATLAFDPGVNGDVLDIALDGTTVYAVGDFTTAGGQPRAGAVSFQAAGALNAWDPDADDVPTDVAVGASAVYVACGACTQIGGQPRGRVGAVEKTNGNAINWTPNPDAPVHDIAVAGSDVWLAGEFRTVAGAARDMVANVDADTGALDPWSTDFTLAAYNVLPLPTGLFVGGDFTRADQVAQGSMAIFDLCDRTAFCDSEGLRDYVSISTPASVAMPTAIPEVSSVESFDVTVQSNALFGYSLLATDTSDTAALSCTTPPCTGSSIPDWTGLPGTPSAWSDVGADYGFGVTVLGSTLTPKDSAWGTGALASDLTLNRYVGLRSGTPTTLHAPDRFVANTEDVTTIGLRVRVDPTQMVGTYQGTIMLTAIANP